jgi:hypothetical protein
MNDSLTREKEGEKSMDRMFRVLAFWTGIFAVMFYTGDMMEASLLSLVQTAFFLTVGYLKLSERMYVYIFFSYLTVFMIGFTYYCSFILVPGFGGH